MWNEPNRSLELKTVITKIETAVVEFKNKINLARDKQ